MENEPDMFDYDPKKHGMVILQADALRRILHLLEQGDPKSKNRVLIFAPRVNDMTDVEEEVEAAGVNLLQFYCDEFGSVKEL